MVEQQYIAPGLPQQAGFSGAPTLLDSIPTTAASAYHELAAYSSVRYTSSEFNETWFSLLSAIPVPNNNGKTHTFADFVLLQRHPVRPKSFNSCLSHRFSSFARIDQDSIPSSPKHTQPATFPPREFRNVPPAVGRTLRH